MIRRIFDPERKVYAVKPLTTLGVEFAAGEEIDWRAFDFPQRTIEMWFRLRLISHFPGGDQSQEAIDYHKTPAAKATHLTTGAKQHGRGRRKAKTAEVEESEAEVEEPSDEE